MYDNQFMHLGAIGGEMVETTQPEGKPEALKTPNLGTLMIVTQAAAPRYGQTGVLVGWWEGCHLTKGPGYRLRFPDGKLWWFSAFQIASLEVEGWDKSLMARTWGAPLAVTV
jgi:hypothetical protein